VDVLARVVVADALVLGEAGERVVLAAEAEDGAAGAVRVARGEGGGEAGRAELDPESCLFEEGGLGEGGLPLAQAEFGVLPDLGVEAGDPVRVLPDPVQRGRLGGAVPGEARGGT